MSILTDESDRRAFAEALRHAEPCGPVLKTIIEMLVNALDPFSDQAEFWSDQVSDNTPLLEKDNLTVGDIRRAQKAIIEYHHWKAAQAHPLLAAPKPFTFADPSAQLQHERHRAESKRRDGE